MTMMADLDLVAMGKAIDAALAGPVPEPEKPTFAIPRVEAHPTVMTAITDAVEKTLTGNHKTTVARRKALIEDLAQALAVLPIYGIDLDYARLPIGDGVSLGNADIETDGYGNAVSIRCVGTPIWDNE